MIAIAEMIAAIVPDRFLPDSIKMLLPAYINALHTGKENADYKNADTFLTGIKNLQKKYSSSILPSDNKVKAEVAYNKFDVFKKLMRYYGGFGILLFIILIFQIFSDNKLTRISVKTLKIAQ